MRRLICYAVISVFWLAGCQKDRAPAAGKSTGSPMALSVTSAAFEPAGKIPGKHAYVGEGENVSPPLSWSGAPAGTRSYALICDDPDAPSRKNPRPGGWVHWVLFNIPAKTRSLAEGAGAVGVAGNNDWGKPTWGGPLPPRGSGTHRYFFRVFALDRELDLPAGSTRKQVQAAMEGHVLARGELHGTYERVK